MENSWKYKKNKKYFIKYIYAYGIRRVYIIIYVCYVGGRHTIRILTFIRMVIINMRDITVTLWCELNDEKYDENCHSFKCILDEMEKCYDKNSS